MNDTERSKARGSTLRKFVEAEHIELPKETFKRKTSKIILFSAQPFLFIGIAICLATQGLITLPLVIVLLLMAQRMFQTLVHDSSHLFFSRERVLNDRLGNFLAAGFIGMRIQNYRDIHFKHHAANGSEDDPEYTSFEMVRKEGGVIRLIAKYLFLLESIRLVKKYYFKSGRGKSSETGIGMSFIAEKGHILCAQSFLVLVFFLSGAPWLYAVWLYLAMSLSPLLSRLRFLVEHPGSEDLTITTESNLTERLLFAPLNFNYHFEHHCWPSIPPYKLAKAHKELVSYGFFQRHSEYVGRSFISTLIRRFRNAV